MKVLNELLGHWICPEGGRAEVYQTKKQGRHFYTRCECCGLMQGTGKGRQQAIFDSAEFINRDSIVVPSGVSVGGVVNDIDQPATPEFKEPEKAEKTRGDFDPREMQVEQEQKQVQPGGGGFLKALVPLAVLMAAIGAGAWMN